MKTLIKKSMEKLIISILLFLLAINAICQNSFGFLHHTPYDNTVNNGVVDHEGNAILVGQIGEFYTGLLDGFVMKVHPDGSYTTKQFESPEFNSSLNAVVVLDNGNYLVLGSKGVSDNLYYRNHFWVMVLDYELEVLTEFSFEINNCYTGIAAVMKALIDNEGNIVVAGIVVEKINEVQYFSDYVMYKLTQQGDTLLSRYYQFPYNQMPYELMKIPESDELLLLGDRITTNAIPSLIILDADMEIVNSYSFQPNPSLHQRLNAAKWLNETDFLMAGTRQFQTERYIDNYIAVLRMNTSAQMFEELVLSVPDTSIYRAWNKSITEANDSTIYVAGFQAFASNTTPNAVYLFLIDSQMNLIGRKDFFIGDAQYQARGVLPMHDDGCLMYISKNRINDQGILERDIYIRKYLREDFEIITKVEHLPEALPPAKAWPNPARDEVNISLSAFAQGQNVRFRMYDAQGQKYVDKQIHVTGNSLRLGIGPLPAGLIVYELEGSDGKKQGGKFIKE
jgi:hypothetical protein